MISQFIPAQSDLENRFVLWQSIYIKKNNNIYLKKKRLNNTFQIFLSLVELSKVRIGKKTVKNVISVLHKCLSWKEAALAARFGNISLFFTRKQSSSVYLHSFTLWLFIINKQLLNIE